METLLSAESLALKRGERLLFQNLSLELNPGSVLAISGPSGAGKTSLLRLLSGETKGEGKVVRAAALAEIPQGLALNEELLAWENVAMARFLGPRVSAWSALLPASTAWEEKAKIELAKLGVQGAEKKVAFLSGGERQRIAVARALVSEWKVLLADEPVSQLDMANARLVLSALVQATKERNGALVLVLHHEGLAKEFANQYLDLGGKR